MSILDRFAEIMKANINALLDKCEDPSKMVDQYLRDMTEQLAEVKKETAGVMAEETRCKRLVDKNEAEIARYDNLARAALKQGNEADAKTFLAKKQQLVVQGEGLQKAYEAAAENATKMRQMHDKLVTDIESLKARKESIKAKVAVAKTQEKINQMTSGAEKAKGTMEAFDRMEARADEMLDRANAMTELNTTDVDPVASLEEKYANAGNDAAVDAELEALKAEMGLA